VRADVERRSGMSIKRTSVLAMLVVLVFNAQNLRAQNTSKDQLDALVTVAADAAANRSPAPFSVGANIDLFALAIALRKQTSVFVATAEDARVDKQVGGGDTNAGSTSLVSKGSVPSILGFAVENGALTRETSGTTITFRGNPVGIIHALGQTGFVESYVSSDRSASTRFLRKFSFALSFDTARGAPSNTNGAGNVFTGDLQQLASYSLRFDIVNHRDPRDKRYNEAWHELVVARGLTVNQALRRLGDALEADPVFIAWHAAASTKVEAASASGASRADLETLIRSELGRLTSLSFSGDVDQLAEAFERSFKSFLQARGNILGTVAKGPIVTFEYTNLRKVDEIDQSNFKLIAEGAFFRGRVDLAANASLTILNKIPAGMNLKRVQDVDLSGQLDVPLGEVEKVGSIVLSFAGKYKHMMQDTMMANGMMADTKGDIGVGQVKLTIPVKGSGVRIPISFTFANRTELIKEKIVRGNIGLTFDLDSIFARFKP
jgi:hypothetical protein